MAGTKVHRKTFISVQFLRLKITVLCLGYRYHCPTFTNSQLCKFKVVTDLHKLFSPEVNLVTEICSSILFRKQFQKILRKWGKIYGGKREVNTEFNDEKDMNVGKKKVQSHLRSLEACKEQVSKSCILEKKVRKLGNLSTNSCPSLGKDCSIDISTCCFWSVLWM